MDPIIREKRESSMAPEVDRPRAECKLAFLELQQRLESTLRAGLDDIRVQVQSINASVTAMQESVSKHSHILIGNGQPGLSEQVRHLNEQCAAHSEQHKESDKRRWGMASKVLAVCAAILLQIVIAWAAARGHIPADLSQSLRSQVQAIPSMVGQDSASQDALQAAP